MKQTIFSILIILAPFYAFSQLKGVDIPVNEETKKVTYSEVIQVESQTKENLFIAALDWATRTFNSGDAAIEYEDKSSGTIAGKGRIPVELKGWAASMTNFVRFYFKIEVKDGRFRYTFTDFVYEVTGPAPANYPGPIEDIYFEKVKVQTQKQAISTMEQIDSKVKEMINGLQLATAKKDTEDW
ncbi:MAG: DUF4468 domain-containing protein [Bacteroidia bacterium]|nr:DUF4468 domain-containing protein [Bacteroidia bacterium]